MEWRTSNRLGRPLSMADTLRLTGAGSATSLHSSAPGLLHALRTRCPGDTAPYLNQARATYPGGLSRTYQNVMQRKEEWARRKHSTRHILSTTQNYRFTSQVYSTFPFMVHLSPDFVLPLSLHGGPNRENGLQGWIRHPQIMGV